MQVIKNFIDGNITSKQATGILKHHKVILSEKDYNEYFNVSNKCPKCGKEMKFLSFYRGYKCSVKCDISEDKIISNIKSLYNEFLTSSEQYKLRSFSQTVKKYIIALDLPLNNLQKTIYDLIFPEAKNVKCKCCTNKVKFSSTRFEYSSCCSSSCMTKYQMNELTPWTKERKSKMVKNIRETNIEKYGVSNPAKLKEVQDKMKETRIKNGNMLEPKTREDFKMYSYYVWLETYKHQNKLIDREKRGRCGIEGAYNLDHLVSVYDGFQNNIPTYIIGSINNLKYIPWEENLSKNKNSSIEIRDLLESFFNK
jgi:hypothetical protein